MFTSVPATIDKQSQQDSTGINMRKQSEPGIYSVNLR